MKRKLHFSGPVCTGSGYGTHARQLLKALVDSGEFDVTVESLRWGETPFLADTDLQWIRDLVTGFEGPFDLSIQVTIPNEFRRRAPLTIGVTAGIEVDRVSPQWILRANQEVDAVVVPSEHSRQTFLVEYQGSKGERLKLEKPIFVIPEGVDTSVYHPALGLSPTLDKLDVPGKNFVFVGLGLDKPGGKDRKNVTRLIEYFCKTFKGVKEVGLILKVSIVNGSTVDFELVKKRVAEIKRSLGCTDFPRIYIVHGRAGEQDLAEIYNDPRVIAAISLTHGEGYGLPLIEAAACGLPVMATAWSGHLDFLTKDGRKLFVPFEYDLAPIPQECVWEGVMEAGTNWANVREADVSAKMQKMALSSTTPRKWAAELSEHIIQRLSVERTGETFMQLVRQAVLELDAVQAPHRIDSLDALRNTVREKGPSLIYTMPMSAGDVFLSTGVVRSLREKHPGHRVYFATSPQYFDIVRGLHDLIDEVIPWEAWMQSPEALERVFDFAYTPNLNVQHQWANWVHGGHGRNLIDEFAAQCNVAAATPALPDVPEVTPQPTGAWITVHAGGQKSARAWAHWTELVRNLRENGVRVAQVGSEDDIGVGEVDLDLRGKTDHVGLVRQLTDSGLFIGIDSYPMHVAAVAGTRTIALFGSSYPSSTGPKQYPLTDFDCVTGRWRDRRYLKVIETPSRNGCERACYKDTCRIDSSNPCINNISPESVFIEAMGTLFPEREVRYRQYRPRVAGYTHIMNPGLHGYPYVQSIESMLGFCDEVIVVDGGSTDSSREVLREVFASEIEDGKLKVITREWDPDEPGMDGMQKAFGRAMVSPDIEFLWQQDADEVVHELDYAKVHDVCKRFPKDVDIIHLPVVELWGDDRHARTDRHSWKWRLSRNNVRVTHGIAMQARQIDPATGRVFAKKGMSDGCEMIDMVTGDHLPHRGFYSKELDEVRVRNPAEYGRTMNDVFGRLPSVWHYSWADLPRKVRNFRDFWDRQWQVLYQSPAEPRFPDVVTEEDVQRKAAELKERGGEHGRAATFQIDREPPQIMKGWIHE